MAYVAISSDLHGYIFSIDHAGDLYRNHHLTPGGPLAFPGLGERIGTGWGGIRHLGATRAAGHLVVAGVRANGSVLAAQTPIPALDEWTNVVPAMETIAWAPLVSLCASTDGTLYGVTADKGLLQYRKYLQQSTPSGPITLTPTEAVTLSRDFAPDAGKSLRLSLLTNGERFLDVTVDGHLRYQSRPIGSSRVNNTGWRVLGRGWTGYQRVFAAGTTSLYAIGSEGKLIVHHFAEDEDGELHLLARARALVVGTGIVGWATLPAAVEGYSTPQSVKPGEVVTFHTSARITDITTVDESEPPPQTRLFHVDYVRLRRQMRKGKLATNDRVIAAVLKPLVAKQLRIPSDWLVNGVQWPAAFDFAVPPNTPSGVYAARCRDEADQLFYIPFIVRPAKKSASFAVIANTNTWNTYNSWGGFGKYVRHYPLPRSIPFERPHPGLTPDVPSQSPSPELFNQSNHLLRAELWVLGWLDGLGSDYTYDLYTDRDLHDGIDGLSDPTPANRYKALILTVHPEYWTAEMYDAAKAYQDMGGSIVYLGGNGIYEQVLFERSGVGLTIFPFVDWDKYPKDVSNETVRQECLWRVRGKPERALIGVGFEECAGPTVHGQPYLLQRAHQTKNPALKGLKLKDGAELGATSANPGFQADGWEIDQRGQSTPAAANANGALIGLGACSGMSGEMLFYETPANGVVFAGSSLSFGGSLAADKNLQIIVKNVLDIALLRQCITQ